jgi:hypothetical protein
LSELERGFSHEPEGGNPIPNSGDRGTFSS